MATTAWIGGGSSVKQRLTTLRALRRDASPLVRPADRTEALVISVLTVAIVIAWLVTAIVCGRWADQKSLLTEHSDRGVHAVWATEQESAAQVPATDWDGAWVPATYTLPGGRQMRVQLAVPLNSRAGQRWSIYVSPSGAVAGPPMTTDGVRDQVAFTVFTLSMGFALVLGVALVVVRLLFNRRRMAGWQRDWDAVGPTWLRQG
jgi:hypothetical protein